MQRLGLALVYKPQRWRTVLPPHVGVAKLPVRILGARARLPVTCLASTSSNSSGAGDSSSSGGSGDSSPASDRSPLSCDGPQLQPGPRSSSPPTWPRWVLALAAAAASLAALLLAGTWQHLPRRQRPPAASMQPVATYAASTPVAWLSSGRSAAHGRSAAQHSGAACPSRAVNLTGSLEQQQQEQQWEHGPAAASPAFAAVSVSNHAAAVQGATFQRQRANEVLALKLTLMVQQLMAAHVVVKILAVFIVAAPIVYAGGLLYSLITGSTIQLGLLKIYSVVIRVPGAKVTEEKSLAAALLMNAAFLVGLFSFAVLIGIVSEEIKSQVKEVRSGNYPVHTADHTLVLNWNRSTLPLLRNIAENQHGCDKRLGREVVILAEHSKDKMDAQIMKSRSIAESRLKVVTREGAPWCVADLESVSAARAKTVILLHPDDTQDADTKKAAAVLGLEVARSHPSASLGCQDLILQRVPGNPGQMRLFRLVKESVVGREMSLVEVNGSRNISRLIAQSAVQPGIANIYSSIAQSIPGAPDFYLRACGDQLEGSTFQEARRSFPDAVVCGYVSQLDTKTYLNPPDATKLHAADRLIVLAHSGNLQSGVQGRQDMRAASVPSLADMQQRLEGAVATTPRPKKIVVLGWRGHVTDLATAIDDFAAPGTEVVFVSRWPPDDMPESTAKCSFRYLEGVPFDHEVCRRAGVGSCDSIIIGTMECMDSKAADARTLSSLLVVQDLVCASSPDQERPPHVVATIHRSGTVRMARHILADLGHDRMTAELLTPNELVSGMLLQVANEPGLAPALMEVIDAVSGTELYLQRPAAYNLDGAQATSFAEVVELARLRGETAIGYVGKDGSLVLAPEGDTLHIFSPETRVVVMGTGSKGHVRRGGRSK